MVIIFPVLQNPYSTVFYQPCPQIAPQRTRYSAPSRFSRWYLYQTDYEVLYRPACTAAPLARLALEVFFVKAQVLPSWPVAKMEALSVMNMNLDVESTLVAWNFQVWTGRCHRCLPCHYRKYARYHGPKRYLDYSRWSPGHPSYCDVLCDCSCYYLRRVLAEYPRGSVMVRYIDSRHRTSGDEDVQDRGGTWRGENRHRPGDAPLPVGLVCLLNVRVAESLHPCRR